MFSRAATLASLHPRTVRSVAGYPTSVPTREEHTPSFSRDYFYRKMRKCIRLVRHAIRVCRVVQKYAIEALRRAGEQIVFENKEILFDLSHFRRPAEETIGRHIRKILKSAPTTRSEEDLRMVVMGLGQNIPSFTEFPLRRQYSIARVARLEEFEMGRVILREGHRAEKFYLIIDGITDVYKLWENPITNTTTSRLVAVLKKGSSFGEIALISAQRRTATVSCQTNVTMLSIEQEDFIKIFMADDKQTEPDYITYLRQIPEFCGFPIEKIPFNSPYLCHAVYYRIGTVMCKDSNEDEWLYVIRSGFCRVIKSLTQVTPNLRMKQKPQVIYDLFGTQRKSQYSIEALGAYRRRAASAKPAKCYTEIEQLREKSVFGLVNVIFGQLKSVLSVTLISDGAECIRIRKSFFIKHTSESLLDRLRREVRPYVTDDELQNKLQHEVDWTAYKNLVVRRIQDRNKNNNSRLTMFNH